MKPPSELLKIQTNVGRFINGDESTDQFIRQSLAFVKGSTAHKKKMLQMYRGGYRGKIFLEMQRIFSSTFFYLHKWKKMQIVSDFISKVQSRHYSPSTLLKKFSDFVKNHKLLQDKRKEIASLVGFEYLLFKVYFETANRKSIVHRPKFPVYELWKENYLSKSKLSSAKSEKLLLTKTPDGIRVTKISGNGVS